jgi:hypothetical protein
MTGAEREAWLDRLCQLDDDPSDGPQEYWDPESGRRAAHGRPGGRDG